MLWAFQVALVVKNLLANAGDIRDGVRSLGGEDPLKGKTATHSSIAEGLMLSLIVGLFELLTILCVKDAKAF